MKVLISAYACEPDKGSEPSVGWNWALQSSRSHLVWVLTRANNRRSIEQACDQGNLEGITFEYHDLPSLIGRLKRPGWRTQLYYLLWQLSAIIKVRRLHRIHGFDLGHHVTFVTARHPTVFTLLDIPFVWGPIGGGEAVPKHFMNSLTLAQKIGERIRAVSNSTLRHNPIINLTARKARVIIAVTPESRDLFSTSIRRKILVHPAIGVDRAVVESKIIADHAGLNALFVGRLLHWKGIQWALEAIAQTRDQGAKITLTIVGDGPYHSSLRTIVKEQGLSLLVTFTGWLPHDQVMSHYERADVFVFPSLHDSGGQVILEAMSYGLPVITLRSGGPGQIVDAASGYLVEPTSPEEAVKEMASALIALSHDRAKLREMSKNARERILSRYLWSHKAAFIEEVYNRAVSTGIYR